MEAREVTVIGCPTVSVVIPAYNAAGMLPDALQTAVSQTVEDIEIIVVDDGSADSTAEVARAFGDDRIKVLRQENAGCAAARNTGITAATGKYVAFLDADDLWLPTKLQRQLDWFATVGPSRALQTGVVRVDEDLNVMYEGRCPAQLTMLDALCFRGMPGLMSTLIVDRDTLLEEGGFDPSLQASEDWDIAIRLGSRGPIGGLAEALAAIRVHPAQKSCSVADFVECGFRVLEKVFSDPELPTDVRRRRRLAYASFYAMLSGGEWHYGRLPQAIRWGLRAIVTDPRITCRIAAMPLRRLRRKWRFERNDTSNIVLGALQARRPARAIGREAVGE